MPTTTYKQPKNIPIEKTVGSDYPQTDIGIDDVWVKGKYPAGAKKKVYHTMRGVGAATKGTKFLESDDM